MGRKKREQNDAVLREIQDALKSYLDEHPKASLSLYRQNLASIRVRIIDAEFSGLSQGQRHELIWSYLEPLSEETLSELTILLLLTPSETKRSIANLDFEHPIPSML